jgi:hypothetical protein
MLEQDYIMRLVREFFEALELFIRQKRPIEVKIENLRALYDQYVGPAAFYQTAEMADVMDSFGRFEESQRIHRMEMLAELYYIDADLHTGPQRDDLLNRALTLFRYIDSHSDTFSFDRLNKINRLEKSLNTN